MEREIIAYHLDEHNDWVAELNCYHDQHVRHNPPFINRPWVTTDEGRQKMLGSSLNCVRCDRLELPDNMVAYKKTPEFNEKTIPSGLLKEHSTKSGTWGIIHILEGSLLYTVNYPQETQHELSNDKKGVIAPCMLHRVAPKGNVKFYVEFYSRNPAS